MTDSLPAAPTLALEHGSAAPGVAQVARVELAKLAAQTPARLAAAICVLAPFAFGAVLAVQSAVPADTLFGRWVHASGFALPLVVLGFAGSWGFPVLAGVVAGDVFAGEDRHDTWKTLLTRSSDRRAVFAGKTLAAVGCTALMVTLLAVSSLVAGLLFVGAAPLVDLSGTLLSSEHALALVVAGWATALVPVTGFVALAILLSVTTRSSVVGVLGPVVVAVLMQLLALVGKGEIARDLLLATALDAWHGLFVVRPYYGPLARGEALAAVCTAVFLAVAWVVLRRRDFAGAGVGSRRSWLAVAGVLGATAATVGLLAALSGLGPSGITASRLETSLAGTFSNLTVYQQTLLGRTVPAGAELRVLPTCRRRGVSTPTSGAGDDWHCTLSVVGPGARQTPVGYDVNVRPNGCYTADGPPSFVGPATIRRPGHGLVGNPLFVFDGCFDTG
jgi:ABC-2 type transport system permease protein